MSRSEKIPVPQEPLPPVVPEVLMPRQRGRNISQVVVDTVESVRHEMPGHPEVEVLATLVDRLTAELPGVTFDRDRLREHARSIHESEPRHRA